MKIYLPYNINYHFDENLRDVPDDPEDMARALDYLLDYLPKSEQPILVLGRAGSLARTLMRLDLAADLFNQAIDLAQEQGNDRAVFVNSLRLAHVIQWKRDFAESNRCFGALIAQVNHDPELARFVDFTYQHAGKNAFDQGDYVTALGCFRKALAIREEKGDPSLIESTQHAIAVTLQRMDVDDEPESG